MYVCVYSADGNSAVSSNGARSRDLDRRILQIWVCVCVRMFVPCSGDLDLRMLQIWVCVCVFVCKNIHIYIRNIYIYIYILSHIQSRYIPVGSNSIPGKAAALSDTIHCKKTICGEIFFFTNTTNELVLLTLLNLLTNSRYSTYSRTHAIQSTYSTTSTYYIYIYIYIYIVTITGQT